METVADFIFWVSKITVDGDCSHEIKDAYSLEGKCRRIDAFELWRILLSTLDCKEIQPVHPKGNQSCIFIRRTGAEAETPVLWPPDAKN